MYSEKEIEPKVAASPETQTGLTAAGQEAGITAQQ